MLEMEADVLLVSAYLAYSVVGLEVGIAAVYCLATDSAWHLLGYQTLVAAAGLLFGGCQYIYDAYKAGKSRVEDLEAQGKKTN